MIDYKLITDQLLEFIPKLGGAIAVFIIGWIIARYVSRLINKLLSKTGLHKLDDKLQEIELISKTNIKVNLAKAISRFLYYLIFLVFIVAAIEILGIQALSDMIGDLINYIPVLLVAFLILVAGLLFAEFLRKMLLTALSSLGVPAAKLISFAFFYFLVINVFISALGQAKIETDFISQNLTLIIGGAVAAFAIGYGFASRDVLANFLSSFYSKDKVRVGDIITIAGITGTVIEIDKSSVILESEDKKTIIPLNKLISETIEIHNK